MTGRVGAPAYPDTVRRAVIATRRARPDMPFEAIAKLFGTSTETARRWFLEDDLERASGPKKAAPGLVVRTVRFGHDLIKDAETRAEELGLTFSQLVRDAVEEKVDNRHAAAFGLAQIALDDAARALSTLASDGPAPDPWDLGIEF